MSLSNPQSWESYREELADTEFNADNWTPKLALKKLKVEPGAGEPMLTPALMIVMRCRRCYKAVARYTVEDEHREAGWQRPVKGCACDPVTVLPQGRDLARLVARARAKGPQERHRAAITESL